MFLVFHLAGSTCRATKNICCGMKKVVAQSRARVNFAQQVLALLPVFHQTHLLGTFGDVCKTASSYLTDLSIAEDLAQKFKVCHVI